MTPKSFDIPDIPDIPGLDDDEAGAPQPRKRGGGGSGRGPRRRWPWLLTGIVAGVLGTLFLPGLVRPYLPAALRGHATRVEGLVVEKGHEGSHLLLTVDTREGAMLATFEKRVAEIDLLVARGDSISLGVQTYRPFVEQPELLGVRKFPAAAARGGAASVPPTAGAILQDTATTPRDTAPAPTGTSDTTGPPSHR
jgi:hypothetical protein